MTLHQKIAELDLSPIGYKIAIDKRWPLARIDAVEKLYKYFLQGVLENPDCAISPSKDVDEFWHFHILDTEKYMADCDAIFGRYIHHFPYAGLRGAEDARLQQQRFELSQRIIGEIAERSE